MARFEFLKPLSPIVMLFLLGPCVPSAALGQDDETSSLDAIFKAWSTRQENTQSARFELSRRLSTRKFDLEATLSEETTDDASDDSNKSPKPANLITVEQKLTLLFDGERVGYEVDTEGAKALDMPPRYQSTFDGTSSQMYGAIEPDDPKLGTGGGIITDRPHAFDMDSTGIRPMLLAIRAFHPALGRVKPSVYRMSPDQGQIGDVSCLIVEHAGDQQPHKYYWVDPARDYVILREHETYNGVDRIRKDITYQHDETHGWIPRGWKIVNLDENGELIESVDTTVTDYAINVPIPLSEFQIEYPDGTHVTDERTQKDHWVGGNPHLADSQTKAVSMRWLLIANAVLIALLIAFFGIRRYIQRRRA